MAVMVGGFPRKGGMERKDVMAKNVAIYKSQAAALEKGAKKDVKVAAWDLRCFSLPCLHQFWFGCCMNSAGATHFAIPAHALLLHASCVHYRLCICLFRLW